MKNKNWLVGAGIVALVFAAYKSSAINKSISFLQYQIAGIRFKLGNIFQPEIIFSIAVSNPNDTAVPVENFFGNIKNGASMVATFNSVQPIQLAAGQTATIDVSAKVNALSVILQLLNKNKIKSLNIEGVIKTGLFDQPFSKEVAIPAIGAMDHSMINQIRQIKQAHGMNIHHGKFMPHPLWFKKNGKWYQRHKPRHCQHHLFQHHNAQGFLQYPKRHGLLTVTGTNN